MSESLYLPSDLLGHFPTTRTVNQVPPAPTTGASNPAMSSNSQVPASKTTNQPAQLPSPSQSQPSSSQGDGNARRSGGSGSYGSGANTRPASAPRNSQSFRKQHKGRRPKLAAEDTVAEVAAMRSSNSRKGQTSITHLMNISIAPAQQSYYRPYSQRNAPLRRPTWGLGSGYHAVDKARYIHANYRFIVDPRGDYSRHTIDSDLHVDWSNILQILASSLSQNTSCPICLSTPIAPRMAKCGHIFCLPCLIRYMHSTDDNGSVPEKKQRWKACPICWDSVYMSEVRPVRFVQGQEGDSPREGGDVVLRLIARRPGSILALPRDGAENSSDDGEVPWYFAAEVTDYARIMKGTEDYMVSSFDREIEEIRFQEQEDQVMFGEEDFWTKKAISTVNELKERAKGTGNPPPPRKKPVESVIAQDAKANFNQTDTLDPHSGRQFETSFHFYQALLHYYLSPLDIRILKAAFGDYSLFPATILPRVERVDSGHIVDDDLRRRAKYLGHLPHGCEVGFLECDWTDVVPAKVLEQFSAEIGRRRKRNLEKSAREEKERIRAEKEEDDKRWAAARRKRPSMSKARDDSPPGFATGAQHSSMDTPALGSSVASSSPPWGTSRRNGSAFASLASPSTSPSAPRTVWGTAAVATSPSLVPTQVPEPYENDGWLQGWEQDLLQGEEELLNQVKATSLGEAIGEASSSATPPPSPAVPATGAGKKKKGKKITLMSTNARRAA